MMEDAQLIIYETLQSFVANPLMLRAASRTVADLFMKECRPNGQVVSINGSHTMNLAIVCLDVMPTENKTDVLGFLKELLELHNTGVTVTMTEALRTLCLKPTLPDMPLKLLLELICLICVSISQRKTKYNLSSIVGLLGSGVSKICSVNKDIGKTKLPIVIDAILVLLQQRVVVMDGAIGLGNALRCLIAYIDDDLIKEGIDRGLMNASVDHGIQAEPTVIEKLSAAMSKLLSYPCFLSCVFGIISAMFEKLGEHSSYLMKDTIKILAELQKFLDDKSLHKLQGKRLLEMVVQKCGIDAIMAMIPQEHVQLLLEIQQEGSKYVGACSHVIKGPRATDPYGRNVYKFKNMNQEDFNLISLKNYKRRNAGKKCLSNSQLRAILDKQAKRRATEAIREGLEGATKMTKKLKL